MYLRYDEGVSEVAERFVRTLETSRYMKLIYKNFKIYKK